MNINHIGFPLQVKHHIVQLLLILAETFRLCLESSVIAQAWIHDEECICCGECSDCSDGLDKAIDDVSRIISRVIQQDIEYPIVATFLGLFSWFHDD